MDEKKKQFTLLEWLGYREFPLYEKARWLGHTLGFAIVAVAILMLVLAAYVLFQFAMAVTGQLEANGEAIRNIGFVVAALVGLPFIVWRAVVAQQQVNVAEQSHITDRISKAVEQLGAEKTVKRVLKDADGNPVFDIDGITPKTVETTEPNIEVRLGGIYALERISKDSLPDHIQIMEILCAYIRENAPAASLDPTELLLKTAIPRNDIQAVITILARCGVHQNKLEFRAKHRLDLSRTNLDGIDFKAGDFTAALFHRCRFEAANFSGCDLTGTQFNGSLMNFCEFQNCKIVGTSFDRVTISRPLEWVFFSTSFANAELHSLSCIAADLSAMNILATTGEMNRIFGTLDTKLHERYFDQKDQYRAIKDDFEFSDEGTEKRERLEKKLEKIGFRYWSQFDSGDLAVGKQYKEFLDAMGLNEWPHRK